MSMPWAAASGIYSVPGSLTFKLRLGEAPERIPPADAVRAGAATPRSATGIGPVDRVLGHFADRVRITRVHSAAAGAGALDFDDLEQATGVARTFYVSTAPECSIEDLVNALRMLHVVEAATPQYLATAPFAVAAAAPAPLDLERAWATREQISGPAANAYEPGLASVTIAVLDTGIRADHAELGDNVRLVGPDVVDLGAGDLAPGLELLGDTSRSDYTPADEVGHGSSCVGIIGARGTAIPPGLAGACTVLPARVLGSAHAPGRAERIGIGRISDIDRGVKRVVDMKAKVLNMSFGTPIDALDPDEDPPHADVVRYALARGCALVAASGNSGTPEAYTPAVLDGVIAVGAVDEDGRPCAFSTSGPHVALAAPGSRVVSLGLEGYLQVTGTSFAAPFVAAAAALLVSRAHRRGRDLDGPAVRDVLVASVRPWSHDGHGAGVLDACAALKELDRRLDGGATTSTAETQPPLGGRADGS
jgi:subtilisin family serine protease